MRLPQVRILPSQPFSEHLGSPKHGAALNNPPIPLRKHLKGEMPRKRVLFIVKRREQYCTSSYDGLKGGLYNSAKFVVDMLNYHYITAKIAQVIDNNDIDREVSAFKPSHVIVEGLWVVPEKFDVLTRLHPSVRWIVRVHSELPFISTEGVASDWILRYLHEHKVIVAFNSTTAVEHWRMIYRKSCEHRTYVPLDEKVIYLPNWYPCHGEQALRNSKHGDSGVLNVACFGAVRPMKNHLVQAAAAMKFAGDRKLRFHINQRYEGGGDQVLKNLRNLFRHTRHELVEHDWYDHETFIELLKGMDVGMSVSFTETFCIVTADMVSIGLPVVSSDEVDWVHSSCRANPNDLDSIVGALENSVGMLSRYRSKKNRSNLCDFSKESEKVWLSYFC